jgi:hypothetical protein
VTEYSGVRRLESKKDQTIIFGLQKPGENKPENTKNSTENKIKNRKLVRSFSQIIKKNSKQTPVSVMLPNKPSNNKRVESKEFEADSK